LLLQWGLHDVPDRPEGLELIARGLEPVVSLDVGREVVKGPSVQRDLERPAVAERSELPADARLLADPIGRTDTGGQNAQQLVFASLVF
jgi:hypothetical protein